MKTSLAAHAEGEEAAAADLSLRLEEPGGVGQLRSLHALYSGCTPVVRTRRPDRIVLGLLRHLEAVAAPERDDRLWLHALGIIGDGGAVVTPRPLRTNQLQLEAQLRDRGLQVIDSPVVSIDLHNGDVVLERPDLTVDVAAASSLEQLGTTLGDEPPPLVEGRWPIVGWALRKPRDTDGVPLARTQLVAAFASSPWVLNRAPLGAAAVLEAFTAATSRPGQTLLQTRAPQELAQELADLMCHARGS